MVLVLTDDQGYGDLGCHGNPILRTPNLDTLYAQSLRLTDFHVGPTCAPTRASLMTGRYGNRTGVWHTVMGRSLLRRDEVTMGDIFAAGGYRTGIFGKWHLGDNYPFRPPDRGFQEVLVHGGGGVGQTPDFWGNHYFDDTYWHNGTPEKQAGCCTDIWFDGALRFIETNRDRPFFVYLSTNAPHGPYNVAEKYSRRYAGRDAPNANFYGMITNIDENVGRLLRRLQALSLDDNTILIFMTDNGTAAGFQGGRGFNAGMPGTKGSEYDGGHRVPCFLRWPAGGLGGGRDVGRLTAHIDLLPTLLEMCRLPPPRRVKFDGKSILPLLKGEGENWSGRTLVTDSQRIEQPEKWRQSAVMTDRWRLVNGKELYDIHADAGQKTDVAGKNTEVVQELRQAYERWWADVSPRFDEYCEIVLGSDKENPARLTCHDWHDDSLPPWDQTHVLKGARTNGFWAVEVAGRRGLPSVMGREGRSPTSCSFSPLTSGSTRFMRESLFIACRDTPRAVRDGFWKLLEYHVAGKRSTQRFDLENDPWELQNLTRDGRYINDSRTLRQQLLPGKEKLDDTSIFWQNWGV